MNSKRILGHLAVLAAALAPLAAHAEPDQKNNRGYVVGKGGVARAANEPQTIGDAGAAAECETALTDQSPAEQSHGRKGYQYYQARSELTARAEAPVDGTPPPATEDRAATAAGGADLSVPLESADLRTSHDTAKNCVGNIR
jgi:hypothetical protein